MLEIVIFCGTYVYTHVYRTIEQNTRDNTTPPLERARRFSARNKREEGTRTQRKWRRWQDLVDIYISIGLPILCYISRLPRCLENELGNSSGGVLPPEVFVAYTSGVR